MVPVVLARPINYYVFIERKIRNISEDVHVVNSKMKKVILFNNVYDAKSFKFF